MQPFQYQPIPAGYVCSQCGTTGVKLWRDVQCCADAVELRCGECAITLARSKGHYIDGPVRYDGKVNDHDCGWIDQIGWLVPAVPTEDGETYWGYTSVPNAGICWWKGLPNAAKEQT